MDRQPSPAHSTPAAVIIGSLLIGAAIVGAQLVPRYQLIPGGADFVYRLDARTGDIRRCSVLPLGTSEKAVFICLQNVP